MTFLFLILLGLMILVVLSVVLIFSINYFSKVGRLAKERTYVQIKKINDKRRLEKERDRIANQYGA